MSDNVRLFALIFFGKIDVSVYIGYNSSCIAMGWGNSAHLLYTQSGGKRLSVVCRRGKPPEIRGSPGRPGGPARRSFFYFFKDSIQQANPAG